MGLYVWGRNDRVRPIFVYNRVLMRKLLLLTLFVFLFWGIFASDRAQAQAYHLSDGGVMMRGVQIGDDTIAYVPIREVVIFRKRVFKNQRDYENYWRLVRNLKKVYPYALVARNRFRTIDSVCATLPSDFARRRYITKQQQELSKEFESQLRDLTFSQGRLLFKLIDRETGRTTYEIIRQFRGGLTATFWQGVATVFSSDLKSTFDSTTQENKMINELIDLYERGQL